MNIVEVLASSALFGQLDRNAVAAIADNAQLRYAGLDEVLYQTGETADSLFLIHTADGNAAGPAIQIAFGDGGGSHVGF
ncbi:hypothetical protein, partial [Altererythrobacter sp.]|uniref:hypothetical protein n=1 Tax=Altererythrobacter sp. TaxID=1872480 RepID=UPI001B2CE347